MFDFNSLNQARQQMQGRDQQREAEASDYYLDALDLLGDFNQTLDKALLREAADLLLESLECKRSQAKPYLCLAYIFYVLNDERKAMKYLKLAQDLGPGLPQVQQLKNVIGGKYAAGEGFSLPSLE